jgi:hypothetical protein
LWYSAGGPSVCVDKQGHDSAGSASYVLAFEDAVSPDTPGSQQQWAWCRKCGVLFFGPNQTNSVCPAGGSHDGSASGNYLLPVSVFPSQSGWLWCDKCQELFYGPDRSTSRCPKDGQPHDTAGSGHYTLSFMSAPVEDQVQNNTTGTSTGQTPWQSFTANVDGFMCQLDVYCGSGDPS